MRTMPATGKATETLRRRWLTLPLLMVPAMVAEAVATAMEAVPLQTAAADTIDIERMCLAGVLTLVVFYVELC